MKLGTAINKPVFSMPKSSDQLVLSDARVGLEIEFENWNGKNGSFYWDNHQDDSLRNQGQEFTTRGGLVGQDIVKAVDEFLTMAKTYGWSEGTPRAGIHVHVDCTDLDISQGQLATFLSLYMLVEHAMFGYAGEWRRACGFCDALEDSDADFHGISAIIFDTKGKDIRSVLEREALHKYMSVNLLALGKFGTVEFRALPTTFDKERILNWINIILQLKKAACTLDIRTSLIKQFSAQGAAPFITSLMGDVWPVLQPYFDDSKAWKAIDNALALMSYAKVVVGKVATSAEEVWEAKTDGSSWVEKKLLSIAGKPKTTSKVVPRATLAMAEEGMLNQFIQQAEQVTPVLVRDNDAFRAFMDRAIADAEQGMHAAIPRGNEVRAVRRAS